MNVVNVPITICFFFPENYVQIDTAIIKKYPKVLSKVKDTRTVLKLRKRNNFL